MADEDFTPEELELLDEMIADLKAINQRMTEMIERDKNGAASFNQLMAQMAPSTTPLNGKTKSISNIASADEKNSGTELVLIDLTPLKPSPSEAESTMVMEQKNDQIEDQVDDSLDLVKTKWAVQVTYSLNNGGLGTFIRDQLLQPFVPINQQTKCTSSNFVPGVFISNRLLDLYTKCGSLFDAQKVFDEMGNRDLCPHWVIMTGMDSTEPSLVQTDENQLLLLTPVSPRLPPKPPDVSYGTMGFAEPSQSSFKENGFTKSRFGGMSVSLAGPDGSIMGSGLAGLRVAAGPTQVVVASFLPGHQLEQKSKKPRMEHISTTATTHVNPISAEEIKISFGGVKPIMMTPGAFQVDTNYVSYNKGQTGAIHLEHYQRLPNFIKQTSMLDVLTEVSVKIIEDVMVIGYYGQNFNGYWFATLSNLVISQALKHALCYQSVAVGPENEFHWHFCNFRDSKHWQFWDGVEFHFCELLISICRNNNMLFMRILQISITPFTSKIDIIRSKTQKSCQYVVWNFWGIKDLDGPNSIGSDSFFALDVKPVLGFPNLRIPSFVDYLVAGFVSEFPASMTGLASVSEIFHLKILNSVYNYMMRDTSTVVFNLRLKHYSVSYFIELGVWCMLEENEQGLILPSASDVAIRMLTLFNIEFSPSAHGPIKTSFLLFMPAMLLIVMKSMSYIWILILSLVGLNKASTQPKIYGVVQFDNVTGFQQDMKKLIGLQWDDEINEWFDVHLLEHNVSYAEFFEMTQNMAPELAVLLQTYIEVFNKPVGLPPSKGYIMIFMVIDRWYKYAHFHPLQTDYTSLQVAEILMTTIIRLHGIPKSNSSDNSGVQDISEATWEDFDMISQHYPHFNLEDKVVFIGGSNVTDQVEEQCQKKKKKTKFVIAKRHVGHNSRERKPYTLHLCGDTEGPIK